MLSQCSVLTWCINGVLMFVLAVLFHTGCANLRMINEMWQIDYTMEFLEIDSVAVFVCHWLCLCFPSHGIILRRSYKKSNCCHTECSNRIRTFYSSTAYAVLRLSAPAVLRSANNIQTVCVCVFSMRNMHELSAHEQCVGSFLLFNSPKINQFLVE